MRIDYIRKIAKEAHDKKTRKEAAGENAKAADRQKRIKEIIRKADEAILHKAKKGNFGHDIQVTHDIQDAIEAHYKGQGYTTQYNGDERTTYVSVSWK